MEAGRSQVNSGSAPEWDRGARPDPGSEASDSPRPAPEGRLRSALFAKCQKGPPGSPTTRVVRSPAEDREDDQETPATAAGDEEAPTKANAPTRVWLGDLPQGVSLPPDCVSLGRNMGKHIRSVGWGSPFCCGRHPTAAKRRQAVASFRKYLSSNTELLLRLEELGGKRLACHCPSWVACHGDALIEAWLEKCGHQSTHLPACTDLLARDGRDSPSGFMWSHGGDVLSMGLGLQIWLRSSTSALGQFAQRRTEEPHNARRAGSPFLPLPRSIPKGWKDAWASHYLPSECLPPRRLRCCGAIWWS